MIEKLKILGHDYSVANKNMGFKSDTVAQCNMASLEIEICSSYPESRQKEGLIHEVIEALNYHLELKLPHNKISLLGESLYQVLKENPDILK